MTLRVELVAPDGEIWSGRARMVIAKTLDGDLGVLTGHSPVLGILAEGSLVRILDPEAGEEASAGGEEVRGRGEQRLPGGRGRPGVDPVPPGPAGPTVDAGAVQAELDAALEGAGPVAPEEEPTEVKYARALLRAAGERS